MTYLRPSLLATLVAASSCSFAAEIDPLEVTVTAKRIPTTVASTAAAVSVLTREEIEDRQLTTLTEALEALDGVYIFRNGTLGSQSKVYLRGTSSNHTIILLNGRRLTSTNDGRTELEYLSLDAVERIEVVRGGLATKYGADAIGGVIQIFTRPDSVDEPENTLSTSLGSDNTKKASFQRQAGIEGGGLYKLTLGQTSTDGFDTHVSTSDGDQDDDGYRNTNLNLYIEKELGNAQLITEAGIWTGFSEYDYAGYVGNNKTKFDSNFLSTRLRKTSGSITIDSQLSKTWNDRTNLPAGSKTHIDLTEFTNTISADLNANLSLSGGLDIRDERGRSEYGSGDYLNKGVFAGATWSQNGLTVDASGRLDNHSQFGYYTTWALGVSQDVSDQLSIYGSINTAFSAPTFSDLDSTYGSPSLKPEEARQRELGLRTKVNENTYLSLAAFKIDTDNLIQYVGFTPSNIDRATSKGAEISIQHKLASTQLSAAYTYTQSEDADGIQLLERPMDVLTLNINHDLSDTLALNANARWVNRLKTVGSNGHMPDYTLLALALEKKVSDEFKFGIKVDNLLDEQYQTSQDYNGRGRYIEASLNYTF